METAPLGPNLTAEEVDESLVIWVKAATYQAELDAIQNGRLLPHKSKLSRLTPIIDPYGIL